MKEQLQNRVASLKREFEAGQAKLQELDRQQQLTRDMLLRISGAIQVLEESLAQGASLEGNGAHLPEVKEEVPV